jgi:hypothetical protein
MSENTKQLLREVVEFFSRNGITVWVFGGWAEELNEVIEPRPHKDLDLLYFSADFTAIDNVIKSENLPEIQGKHFHHKRAFLFKDVMAELFLVEQDKKGFYTNFWQQKKYYWPANLKGRKNDFNVIMPYAIETYRRGYQQIEDLRTRVIL